MPSGRWRSRPPARIILVGAANPGPCGFAGASRRPCECTPLDRQRYRARLSGPIRDRIDLQVLVPRQPAGELLRITPVAEPSWVVRERVLRARERQRERRPQGPLNGALSGPQLRREPLAAARQTLIDAAAHRGALEGGSPTVAVMATGLDRIYPPEHAELAQAIAQSGAVITEAEPGTPPLPGRFPVRNRIISGLSLGVVVVEAAQRSGALITARMAAEQGRDVLCVPGSIENPLATGVHQLIKDGAKLVQTVEDVLDEFAELSRARTRARTRMHARTRARTRADSNPQDPQLLAVWELLDWVVARHHDDLAA